MKLKKFFAGVVAAAMMLTMGATAAFAAEPTDSITVTKVYSLTNATNSSASTETFHFALSKGAKITAGSDKVTYVTNSNATTVPDFPAKYNDITVTSTAGGTDQTFTINYADLGITRPGVYYYTLTEKDEGVAGVTYADPIILVVTAGYNSDTDTTLSYWGQLHESAAFGTKNAKFTNTYSAGQLQLTKTVTGNMGDRDYKFGFTVKLESDKPVNGALNLNGTVDNTIKFEKNTETGKYEATVTGIELKSGETYNLSNIPYGVTYTVSENGEASGKLTVGEGDAAKTYEVTYTAKSADVESDVIKAGVTNSCGATIDTGVILDNAPYIALLAIVAFGGVALILNKRRRDEE